MTSQILHNARKYEEAAEKMIKNVGQLLARAGNG